MQAKNHLPMPEDWLSVFVLSLTLAACAPETPPVEPQAPSSQLNAQAQYIGTQQCAACHLIETELWEGSHHDFAMQPANSSTVLGDFSDTSFSYNEVVSDFFTRDSSYWVRTDGPSGELTEYEITHTFGVDPLQQYLIRFSDGRYQALSIAWDSRPLEQGGQRWFQLYPDDVIDYTDPLHWTGVYQNWNSACAECHSTNLQKNYSFEENQFDTTFSSMDVGCEACHGAGSLHAQAPDTFHLVLPSNTQTRWSFSGQSSIAQHIPALEDQREIEVCAQCHSRRSQLTDDHHPGDPLLDGFSPSLLNINLYHSDGQIQDEVYVYGSFMQSKMHAAGVTCSDCHNPHSTELRFQGDALCGQCHLASVYISPSHHHHTPENPGSACVDCHMPTETYMVVDPRRDHSFRVPRPDLSVKLGTPNACNSCHSNENPQWATGIVEEWFPDGRSGTPHYGEAIHAGRQWTSDRGPLLLALINDPTVSTIVRASAIRLLTAQLDDAGLDAITIVLEGNDPLVQLPALDALASMSIETQIDLGQRFLTHPLRALRIAAARMLLPARLELSERRRDDLDTALAEYWATQQFNSDRAEGLFNSSTILAQLGRLTEAENLLQTAIDRQSYFTAAYVNLADIYRQTGRETEAENVLRSAITNNSQDPAGYFALALSLVRSQQLTAALEALEKAASLAPNDPYYQYVTGIALNSIGERESSLSKLHETHNRFPGHRDTIFALATIYRDGAEFNEAERFTRALLALSPNDAAALVLLEEVEAATEL